MFAMILAAAAFAPPPAPAEQAAPQAAASEESEKAEAAAPEMPAAVRAMVDAALASGNEGEIATVAKYARRAAPEHAPEIDRMVGEYRAAKARAAREAGLNAGLFDRWSGRGDIGGFRSTGSSDTLGISAGLALQREGIRWNHKIRLRGDYQESNGIKTREALLASYEPSYKVSDRMSVYGLGQYERDPFLGFYSRYSLSSGIGYRAINEGPFLVDLNVGPAFRTTRFVTGDNDNTLAGRGSVAVKWTLSPRLRFSHETNAYLESSNSTVAATSALDAKIVGALSARLSYNVQFESHPPAGRDNLDTLSRASLVYDF